jgi:tetratricopeptide (TPR) repeat protein
MDWSYDLLSAEEQICLRRLSVFAGGFSLDAAEVVCADGTTGESGALPVARDPLPAASGDVLDLLTRLVDKSLVIATDLTGAARYRFLETVRQYAAEKLAEAGEADAAHDRHLTWCTALAQAAEGSLCGPPTAGWLARLEQEHDNLRAVLRWSLDRGRGEAALCLAAALPRFWEMRGHLQEGRRWLMRALAAGEHAPTGVRAKGLQGAGVLAYMQGDYAAARALFAQSLDLYRDLGDGYGTADAQGNLGRTALRQGDYATARAFLEAALALHAEHGHTLGVANVQFTLGVLALRQGDYDAARARFATSLTLNRELGNTEGIANALEELATVLGEQGDDGRQAGPLLEESLALYRELGDRSGVAAVLGHLGMAAWARGEHARALVLLDEGLALYREVGDRRGIARLLGNQSLVALAQRDPARAAALCRESLALCREAGDTWAAARYLPIMAGAALALGRPERAARLFGAAAALRGRHGSSLPPVVRPAHDHAVAAARTALGDDVFTAVWGAGQSMPAEAVLDYALTDDDPV